MSIDSDVEYRIEHDTMGEVRVPVTALWRAQTQRAVENFPISGTPIEPALIVAMAAWVAAARPAPHGLPTESRASGTRSPRTASRCRSPTANSAAGPVSATGR